MANREGIAQEIKRLEEMLKDLKPRRTGPKIRRPVKKPNAPGGSKPARKRIIKRKNKPTPGFGTGRST
jgi:hypothetical protein